MPDELSLKADERLESTLAEIGARDPREFYRERLRDLKRTDPAAYDEAVVYYRDVLIPTVAAGDSNPLDEWTEYGRRLASSLAPGRTVSIDPSGRCRDYDRPTRDVLILHLPDQLDLGILVKIEHYVA